MTKPPFKPTIVSEAIFRQEIPSLAEMSARQQVKGERAWNWNISPQEMGIIQQIAARACENAMLYKVALDPMRVAMDITFIHLNIYPLELMQLLMAGEDDFHHDVVLIPSRALDRENGVLHNDVKPRLRKILN